MYIIQNTASTRNRVKQVAGTPACSQTNIAAGVAFVPRSLRICSFSSLQINKLVEYYQQLAQKEKIERDRKKLVRRRNYMPLAFSVSLGVQCSQGRKSDTQLPQLGKLDSW